MKTMKIEVNIKRNYQTLLSNPNFQKMVQALPLDKYVSRLYTPIILFYPSNDSSDNSVDLAHRSSRIKTSLSETLSRYYPLAGQRMKDGGSIECDDEGVDLVLAHANCHLRRIPKASWVWGSETVCSGWWERKRLGLHGCSDHLLRVWGNGDWDVCVTSACWFIHLEHLLKWLGCHVMSTCRRRNLRWFSDHFFLPCTWRWFINHSSILQGHQWNKMCHKEVCIQCLKVRCAQGLHTSHGVENSTRIQVATALIYKIAASRATSLNSQRTCPSNFHHAVNMRMIVIQVMPEKSFGNMVWSFPIYVTAGSEVN